MTRMEKYKEYRDEIAKSSKLGYAISLDNQNIEKFKAEINKINPAILTSMADQAMSLRKGVTEINISQKQVPVEISKLFSTLNKAKNTINQENVNTIFFNLQNNSIVDNKNNVKTEWLEENPDYAELGVLAKSVNIDKQHDTKVEKSLENKYNNFTQQKELLPVGRAHEILLDDSKQTGHHVFVISITVAIIFCIIVVGLLIARMVI